MTKKVTYAFILGLISTACVSHASNSIKVPNSKKIVTAAQNTYQDSHAPSKAKPWIDMTPLSQSIKNRPILWLFNCLLGIPISLLSQLLYIWLIQASKNKEKSPFLNRIPTYLTPILFSIIFFSFFACLFPFNNLAITARPPEESGSKEYRFKKNSFIARLWNYLSFTLSPYTLLIISFYLLEQLKKDLFLGRFAQSTINLFFKIGDHDNAPKMPPFKLKVFVTLFFFALVPPVLTCITGLIYVILKENKKQDKKEE